MSRYVEAKGCFCSLIAQANIEDDELKALKRYVQELLAYSGKALTEAIKYGALIEVENDE